MDVYIFYIGHMKPNLSDNQSKFMCVLYRKCSRSLSINNDDSKWEFEKVKCAS